MVSTSTPNSPATPQPEAAPALTRPGTANAPSASAPEPSPSLSPSERAALDDFATLHRDLFHANVLDTIRTNDDIRLTIRMALRLYRGMMKGSIPFSENKLKVATLALRARTLHVPRPLTPRAPRTPSPSSPSPRPTRQPAATSSAPRQPNATSPDASTASTSSASVSPSQFIANLKAELPKLQAELESHQPNLLRLQQQLTNATNPTDRQTRQRRLDGFLAHYIHPLHQRIAIFTSHLAARDIQATTYATPTPL
jgi:hypothetical protein